MEKYIVKVDILKADKNGKKSSEHLEFPFKESTMIESRKSAIKKAKEIIHSYEYDMPKSEEFDSFLIAQLRGFKNFKAYSLDIIFTTENGAEYQIYGEEEIMVEELVGEASYYYKNKDYQDFTYIEISEEDYVVVLESDIDFFLKLQQLINIKNFKI